MISIYTDGSCSGNGSKNNFGGYGVVVTINNKIIKQYSIGKKNTTNNEMELEAILYAIKFAKILNKNSPKEVIIYSDSAYCVNSINVWMDGWASNGWIKKSDKKPPENLLIMQELYKLMQFERNIKVVKIKGHDGEEFNELADKLATGATKAMQDKYLKSKGKE